MTIIGLLTAVIELIRAVIGLHRDLSPACPTGGAWTRIGYYGRLLFCISCIVLPPFMALTWWLHPDQVGFRRLKQSIANSPDTAGYELALKGNIHFSRGEFQEAIADYTASSAIRAHKNCVDQDVCFNRGLAYAHLGDFKKAKADFESSGCDIPIDFRAEKVRNIGYKAGPDGGPVGTSYDEVVSR